MLDADDVVDTLTRHDLLLLLLLGSRLASERNSAKLKSSVSPSSYRHRRSFPCAACENEKERGHAKSHYYYNMEHIDSFNSPAPGLILTTFPVNHPSSNCLRNS